MEFFCANATMSGPVEVPFNPGASLSRDCKSPGMGFFGARAPPISLPGPDVDVFQRNLATPRAVPLTGVSYPTACT